MKIVDVETIKLAAPLKEPWRIANIEFNTMYSNIVKVTTDEGYVGIGESLVRFAPDATHSIIQELKPVLIGKDPFDIESLWEKMFSIMRSRGHSKGFMIEAISGVDIALWDLIGKVLKLPVYKLLGGCFRERIEVYASSLLFKNTDVLVKEAIELVDEGFTSIKLKIGRNSETDIKNVKTIRDALGYNIKLMVDANGAYGFHTALKLGRKLERYEVYWFEEPLPPYDTHNYVKLSEKLDIPIAAGESEFTRYGFRDLLVSKAVNIIQPNVSRAGGLSECKKIATMASAFNIPYAPHTGASSSVCIVASLHLAACIQNFLIFEYMYPPNPLKDELLLKPAFKLKDGYITVPTKPGLGIELNENTISKYQKT